MNPLKHAQRIAWLALLLVVVFTALGCGDKKGAEQGGDSAKQGRARGDRETPNGLTPEQAAKVVAKVGDRTITVGDITRHINRLHPYIRRRWAAPEKRKEFLDKLIRVELLSQEAERLGLSDDPEVQRTIKQVMVRLLIKNDLEKELLPEKIDEQVLRQQYDQDQKRYYRPAQVRISQIVLDSRQKAVELLAELSAKPDDARLFRQKARELSSDAATRDRGGDVGYVSEPDKRQEDEPELPKAVVTAAWKLQKNGELSKEVVKSEQGYHVIKLTNKRPEMNRSFESVKRMIESRLLREKRSEAMANFVQGLRKKAKVQIFEQNLDKLQVEPGGLEDLLRQPAGSAPATTEEASGPPAGAHLDS